MRNFPLIALSRNGFNGTGIYICLAEKRLHFFIYRKQLYVILYVNDLVEISYLFQLKLLIGVHRKCASLIGEILHRELSRECLHPSNLDH